MKTLFFPVGILSAFLLLISCGGKKQPVKPYHGHLVMNVSLHSSLQKLLVEKKRFVPAMNCIQLVEYSRTPDYSSRSDFYLLFSPAACPAPGEVTEQVAFVSEVQGMEQSLPEMRLYSRHNELSQFHTIRSEISTGWLSRVVEQEKIVGFEVTELCNYTLRKDAAAISACELRIENGRFSIPRDTSSTAQQHELDKNAIEQKKSAKSSAEENREDVIAHTTQLFDLQMKLINDRFSELKAFLVTSFEEVNKNISVAKADVLKRIEVLDDDTKTLFKAQLARMNLLEKDLGDRLANKIEGEARGTNQLILLLQQDVRTRIEELSKQGEAQHKVSLASLTKLAKDLSDLNISLVEAAKDLKATQQMLHSNLAGQIEALKGLGQKQHEKEIKQLGDLMKGVVDLSKKSDINAADLKNTYQKLAGSIEITIKSLEAQNDKRHQLVTAELKSLATTLKALEKGVENVSKNVTDSAATISLLMGWEMSLTNLQLGFLRLGMKGQAASLETKIEELKKASLLETKEALKIAVASFQILKGMEEKLAQIKDDQVKAVLSDLQKTTNDYQGKIDALKKSVDLLESRIKETVNSPEKSKVPEAPAPRPISK